MAAGLGALRDDEIDSGGELSLGVVRLPTSAATVTPASFATLDEVRRRRAEGARDQRDPMLESHIEQFGDDAGVGVHGGHVLAFLRCPPVALRDPVPLHEPLDEADVLLRDLRAQARDQVVGVALRELGRNQQVDAVRPIADPLLDPRQLRVELVRPVRRRREHAETAGPRDLGHDGG